MGELAQGDPRESRAWLPCVACCKGGTVVGAREDSTRVEPGLLWRKGGALVEDGVWPGGLGAAPGDAQRGQRLIRAHRRRVISWVLRQRVCVARGVWRGCSGLRRMRPQRLCTAVKEEEARGRAPVLGTGCGRWR